MKCDHEAHVTILSLNPDPNAPCFRCDDCGLVYSEADSEKWKLERWHNADWRYTTAHVAFDELLLAAKNLQDLVDASQKIGLNPAGLVNTLSKIRTQTDLLFECWRYEQQANKEPKDG